MISVGQQAEIRRLYTVEGWRKHTIARQLGLHHATVNRALLRDGLKPQPRKRKSMIEPFLPWIKETLERYPRLPASTLYEMAVKRGYPGQVDHFRHCVKNLGLRPRKTAEAFLDLRTLPGEHYDKQNLMFSSPASSPSTLVPKRTDLFIIPSQRLKPAEKIRLAST